MIAIDQGSCISATCALEDVSSVRSNSFVTDEEPISYFLVCVSIFDEHQNLIFPFRKVESTILWIVFLLPAFCNAQGSERVAALEKGGGSTVLIETNPRGELIPHDGRGGGVGMSSGRRLGKNNLPCPDGGPGYGGGQGQGHGRNRR